MIGPYLCGGLPQGAGKGKKVRERLSHVIGTISSPLPPAKIASDTIRIFANLSQRMM